MNLSEFAEAVDVSISSASRWIHGRIPRADYLERIADVLVLDYDELATRAGYRPADIGAVKAGSPEAILLPYIQRAEWTEERLDTVKAIINQMIQFDERKRR